jgi:hypothetical protein
MTKIYLDSNIFRFLKKNDTPQYIDLRNKLIQYSGSLLYCYSHAHLLDLKRDATERKEEDLKFMEAFVGKNYLCHYWGEKEANFYSESPTDAFKDLLQDSDVSTINPLEIMEDDPSDDPITKSLKEMLKTIMNTPLLDLSHVDIESLPPDAKKMMGKLIPTGKTQVSLADISTQLSSFYEDLFNKNGEYKELRGYLIKNLDLEKNNVDYMNENFNEDLKKTSLKKTFEEYVNEAISHDGTKEITKDNFIINAFTSLNMLGIDKEKNKKARFPNTFNDGQHGYYATYCDYVVSDDETFLRKCKLIYKLRDIPTKVMHVDDFCKEIESIAGSNPNINGK